MLKDSNVCAVLAVKDIEKAKKFYEGKLGLKEDKKDDGGGVLLRVAKVCFIFMNPNLLALTKQLPLPGTSMM
jgi:catechol 2,3-dioxygenase-like lactoylglutathione lyase family enzyme